MLAKNNLNGQKAFSEVFKRILQNWPYILISITVAMALVYGLLYISTPIYSVSSTLLIQDDKEGYAMSNNTAFSDLNMFQTVKTVDNEIEILRSKDLIYGVLKDLNLESSYFQKSGLKTKELYGKTLPIKIVALALKNGAYSRNIEIASINDTSFRFTDNGVSLVGSYNQLIKSKNYTIRIIKGPDYKREFGKITIQFKDLYKLSESFNLMNLKIVPVVKDANTVVVSLNENIPERGLDILNNLINNYNINNINNKNIIAENTIKFIDNRLRYLVNDLAGVEQDVEHFKQKNQISDLSIDAQLNAARSIEYNQLLTESITQLKLINSIEDYFKNRQHQGGLAPSALGIKDPILNSMVGKFNDLQQEKNRILRTANAENPLVINLNDQLANLKNNILENLVSIKNGFTIEKNNFQNKYAQYNNKSKSVPSIERGILERSREQNVKTGLYQYLLQKREETALSLSTTMPTSQIIDKPAYNTTPISPNSQLLYFCGFIIGCIIPVGFIYVKELFNTKVTDSKTIELTGAKLLGELSHNLDKNTNVFQADHRSTISELFRYIRMNLGFMGDQFQKVILVTSSMEGEGKTFFSINLATTLSMLNKKVVVIELDLRKPALMKKLNITSTLGITDYLNNDDISIDEIIQPTLLSDNVSVIGCCKIPENPAEEIMNPKIVSLLVELKKRFDYIILDTSPVGQVADAFSLKQYVDLSIYLVRYNYTSNYQLSILKNIHDGNKLKNLMVVFNDAKRDKKQQYGYGG